MLNGWSRKALSGRSALLAVAAVAITLGIMGMHALNLHGMTSGHAMGNATSNHAMTQMHDAPVSLGGEHASRYAQQPSVPSVPSAAGHTRAAVSGDEPGHGMGDMVMLCVAMLAAAASALLLLLLLHRVPRAWWRVAVQRVAAQARNFVPDRVGTGPPPVWEFSVIRC